MSYPETPVPEVDEVTAWMLPKPVGEFTGVESVLSPASGCPGAEDVLAGVCGSCSWGSLPSLAFVTQGWRLPQSPVCGTSELSACESLFWKFLNRLGASGSLTYPPSLFSTPACFQPADIALSLPPRPVI